jgi:DNA polymerase-1
VWHETLEADDVLGLLSTSKTLTGKRTIVTIDKDLLTVPGLLWNPDKPDDGVVSTSEEEADYRHLLQTLTGDATDGYSGCPGVGPKTAEKMLADVEPELRWLRIVEAYEKAGFGAEEALRQARVARVLRRGEYDTKAKKVHLWTPDQVEA